MGFNSYCCISLLNVKNILVNEYNLLILFGLFWDGCWWNLSNNGLIIFLMIKLKDWC